VCAHGVNEDTAKILVRTLIQGVMKGKDSDSGESQESGSDSDVSSSKKATGKDNGAASLFVKQPVLFGKPEGDFFVSLILDAANAKDTDAAKKQLEEKLKQNKANFKAMMQQAGYGNISVGLEGAMFGRFVTSDVLSRVDAPVHVAHSFTVHRLDTEVDYFTVVDDLNLGEETGAAHAGDMELGAGIFYGYVAIDIPLLISNLTGCDSKDWQKQDKTEGSNLLKELITTITTVSPGAKLGSTAPYAYSDFLLLEVGKKQPRSLANAFLQAIPKKGDVMQAAITAASNHLQALDHMYGETADHRAVATIKEWPESTIANMSVVDSTTKILAKIFEN
jgi:CRISPR system Cascade subunit CasC